MKDRQIAARLFALASLFAGAAHAQEADLAVTKSGPGTAAAGTNLTYTIGLTNIGPDGSANVTLDDPLPAELTFVSVTAPAGYTCTDPGVGNGGTVSCTNASLASGASGIFTLVATVDPATPPGTFITNAATVSSQTFDPNDENNVGVAGTMTPGADADVLVTKSGPSGAGPDTDIVYTLTVANAGPEDAGTVTLDDALPGDLTFVSLTQQSGPAFSCTTPAAGVNGSVTCTAATLADGASATFALVAHVPPGTVAGTTYDNVATVTSASDPTSENDSSAVTTTISSTDVALTKTGPATAGAGSNVTYVVTLSNNGPDLATQAAWLDALPPALRFVSLTQNNGPTATCSRPVVGNNGSVACSIAVLGAGSSAQFTLVASIDPASANGTVITNAVEGGSQEFDPDGDNNSASAATTVATSADVGVAKSATGGVAGEDAVYTITVSNAGPDAAQSIALTDVLPAGTTFTALTQGSGPTFACTTPAVGAAGTVTCTIAALPSAASAVFTLRARIDETAANGTLIANTAQVAATSPDSNNGNSSATANLTVSSVADLGVTKTGAAGNAGQNATFTIAVSNQGPNLATSVTLTDTLPAGTTFAALTQTNGAPFACTTPAVGASGTVTCTVATLASGATATFTLLARVDDAVANGTAITNTANVAGANNTNPANDSASTTVTVSNLADVAVSKTAPVNASAGGPLAWTLTLSNAGANAATTVQLTDVLPAQVTFASLAQTAGPTFTCTTPAVGSNGTVICSIASLASAATATFTLTGTVVAGTANGTTLTNTATATTASAQANTGNDSGSATTGVIASAALGITKTAPPSVPSGGDITYAITVTNTGSGAASAVTVSDPLPAGVSYVGITQTGGPAATCAPIAAGGNTTVQCDLPSLAAGASAAFNLVVRPSALVAGAISNTATAGASNVGGTSASTALVVIGAAPAVNVPLLDRRVSMFFAIGLALVALATLRRRAA